MNDEGAPIETRDGTSGAPSRFRFLVLAADLPPAVAPSVRHLLLGRELFGMHFNQRPFGGVCVLLLGDFLVR